MPSLRDSVASTLSTPLAALASATSRIAHGGASNTNGVQITKQIDCFVKFLDGTHGVFTVDKTTIGGELLNKALQFIGIGNASKQYFGLQLFVDENDKSFVKWLDADKLVVKQVKHNQRRRPRRFRRHRSTLDTQKQKTADVGGILNNSKQQNGGPSMLLREDDSRSAVHTFQFGVRFYPEDPVGIHDEYARYLVFLQLRSDLAAGRLRAPMSIAALLCSLIVQAELGDYETGEHCNANNSFSTFYSGDRLGCDLLPPHVFDNISYADFMLKVQELHKLHAGQTPADAELGFLQETRKLISYGLFSVRARDASKLVNPDVVIGVSHAGVLVFRATTRTDLVDRVAEPIHSIDWSQIVKISFKRKQFVIEIQDQLAAQPQIVVNNGVAENSQQQQLELYRINDIISGENRHRQQHLNAHSRQRRRHDRSPRRLHQNHHAHQQLDSGLHSTSTVSSSGCSTSAVRGGSNSREYNYDQHSSRSSSVYSGNRESDGAGGGAPIGCFVNMVSMAKLRGVASAKQSIRNNLRLQTRRSTTDSGESGGSELQRRKEVDAVQKENADSALLQQQQPTLTFTFILESSEACKALWKQCIEKHTFYRLESPERVDCENLALMTARSASNQQNSSNSFQPTMNNANHSSAPRLLLQNIMSLGSRLRFSGGSGRFQQQHRHYYSTPSPRASIQTYNNGRRSEQSGITAASSSNSSEIRFVRSSGLKSAAVSRGAAAPLSSSSPSSATTPTTNKNTLLNNNGSSSSYAEHVRVRSGDVNETDMTLVFMQNNDDNDALSDENLTPMASVPPVGIALARNSPIVTTKQTRSSGSQQQSAAARQAIIISSPALSKFNALTNFCRRTVNFIASSSSTQTLSAYTIDGSVNQASSPARPSSEKASVQQLGESVDVSEAVPLRLKRHAWSLMQSPLQQQYADASSPEALDTSLLNNQANRRVLAEKHVVMPPNSRQASSASLPVAAPPTDGIVRQAGRRDSPLLGGSVLATATRNAPKNTNIVWAQQRKTQAATAAALLLQQQQTGCMPTDHPHAFVQQQSRRLSPEKSHNRNVTNSHVSVSNSPLMMEKVSATEIANTGVDSASQSNNCSPFSVARKNAAKMSPPVAAIKSMSTASPAVWQLNNGQTVITSSPSKSFCKKKSDAELHAEQLLERQTAHETSVQRTPSHPGVVRSRSMNYNIDTMTTLSTVEPGMSPRMTVLSTSVEAADYTDTSCSVSPSAAATANGVGGCKLLLKERRGMSVRKNHLPPLRLPNASVSEAFRVIAADQQLNNNSNGSVQAGCGGAGPLVCCRLKPDAEGRFGFNVRGGVDLRSAVIVTRVVPHSPADLAEPTALREGDEILSINGLSTHQRSHEEVVNLIKESWKHSDKSSCSSGVLELVVRPNTFYDYAEFERRPAVANHNHHHHHHHHHHNTRPSVVAAAVDPSMLNLFLPPAQSTSGSTSLLSAHAYQQTPPSAVVTPLGLPSPLSASVLIPGEESGRESVVVSSDNAAVCPRLPDPSTLDGSIQILRDLLVEPTTALATGFEQIYRKNPDMQIACARFAGNIPKNRYRDVLPYDETRVLLKPIKRAVSNVADNDKSNTKDAVVELIAEEDDDDEDDDGDYVNANYIKMSIPKTGVVNHYIATQGPLASTTSDFWRMVWQEDANLIVMLTQLAEQGRPKCHQYWPARHRTLRAGLLNIVCRTECLIFDDSVSSSANETSTSLSASSPTPTSAFSCRREFVVVNRVTREERQVTHLQYMTWPDHGVPSHDSIHFLQFVQEVRMRRAGHELGAPTIIHCSAGIGRTGVLILMETAMCLIEAGEPVEPVGIVQRMRDQRGMLIQTTAQYEFVLHCIVRAFDEKLVQPLTQQRLNEESSPTIVSAAASTHAETISVVVVKQQPTKSVVQTSEVNKPDILLPSSFNFDNTINPNDSGDGRSSKSKTTSNESLLSVSKTAALRIGDVSNVLDNTPADSSAVDLMPTYFAQMHQIHPATPLIKTMNTLCSNSSSADDTLVPVGVAAKQVNGNATVNGAGIHENNDKRICGDISTSTTTMSLNMSAIAAASAAYNNGGKKPPISSTFYCSADL